MHHKAPKCRHQPADRQKIHYNIDERSQRPARPAKNLSDQADRIAESVYLIKRKQENFFQKQDSISCLMRNLSLAFALHTAAFSP
ncbi:MAG: hypothetical protein ACLUYS_08010 [Allobaculum sp.]